MSIFVTLAFLCGAHALWLQERTTPSVITLPLVRGENAAKSLHRRHNAVSVNITNTMRYEPVYFYNISVGTPPQYIVVDVDTTVGYLAIMASNSTYCTSSAYQIEECAKANVFNVSASATCRGTNAKFNATIQERPHMEGAIITDVITIGGVSIPDAQVAASCGLNYNNVLGLGYAVDQTPGSAPKNTNTSLPHSFARAGLINSPAYSFWMDDGLSATILFGGVDTTKYTGTLHTFPVPPVNGIYYMPGIMVTDLVLQTNVTRRITGLPAFFVLDLGFPATYLPDRVFVDIYQQLGLPWPSSPLDFGSIPCAMNKPNYFVTFTFSGVDFAVPLSTFIAPTYAGEDCLLYLFPSGGDWGILGANFLRETYFVHDMLRNEVSLGQRNFRPRSNDSNILEISNGTSGIKGAVTVSVTASGTIPTGDRSSWGRAEFPTGYSPSPTSTEAGAPLATGNPFALAAGILGAGLILI